MDTSRDLHSPLRTQADLEQRWRTLMEPLGFSAPSLWLMLIEPDDRPLPQLIEVAELPEELDAVDAESFGKFLHTVLTELPGVLPGTRVAMLLVRPGGGAPGATDRTRAVALYDGCRRHEVLVDVIHAATDTDLAPIPMDAVGSRTA